jgi:hypothetical protein
MGTVASAALIGINSPYGQKIETAEKGGVVSAA